MATHPTNTPSQKGHVIGELPDYGNIVILMGATGSGKSSFINLLAGAEVTKVGHASESTTHAMKEVNVMMDDRQIRIVDSPGFDDTHLDDYEILRRISDWLAATYKIGVRVTGIIYLREITETRMKGSTLKNFTMFTKLCGTDQLSNVVFVTTKWDQEYPKMREQYEARQEEMRTKFLQNELAMGAKLLSHNNTIQSATEIVRTLLNNPPVVLKIQTQLVDNKKKLRDTDVGEELNTELTKEREKMAKKYAESIADAQATAHNEQLKRLLEKENIALKAELDRIDRQKKALEDEGEAVRQRRLDELDQKLVTCATDRGQTPAAFIKDLWNQLAPVVIPLASSAYACYTKSQADSQKQTERMLDLQRQTMEAQADAEYAWFAASEAIEAAEMPPLDMTDPMTMGLVQLLSGGGI